MLDELLVYYLIINIASFVAFGWDKKQARNRAWRIPEKTLLLLALLGGAAGALVGMYSFRHKTKHNKFKWGVPIILSLQIILLSLAFWP